MERFKVRLEDLEESARVPREEQVEETDASAPAPALKSPDELERELMLRISAGKPSGQLSNAANRPFPALWHATVA